MSRIARDNVPAPTVTKAHNLLRPTRLFSIVPIVIWLFTQLVMTGGWSVGASAIGSAEYAGQSIVICTGDGLVTLYLDENGNPIEGEDGKTLATPCDWCVGFSAPPTLTAATDLLDFAPCESGYLQFAWISDERSPQAVITNARIRAPPVWALS